jgi:hypothetical protein
LRSFVRKKIFWCVNSANNIACINNTPAGDYCHSCTKLQQTYHATNGRRGRQNSKIPRRVSAFRQRKTIWSQIFTIYLGPLTILPILHFRVRRSRLAAGCIQQNSLDAKKALRIFSGALLCRAEGCAIQLQHSPDRLGRSPAPCIQSRPRPPRPSSCPRTQSKYSRSAGNGSPQIFGRRTPSDVAQD